jgi:hypothetical protein
MGSVTVFLGIGRLVPWVGGDWWRGPELVLRPVAFLAVQGGSGATLWPLIGYSWAGGDFGQGSGEVRDSGEAILRSRMRPMLLATAGQGRLREEPVACRYLLL